MNTVRNTWTLPRKGGSRAVTILIETTRPAVQREFDLMARLTAVVEDYMAEQDPGG